MKLYLLISLERKISVVFEITKWMFDVIKSNLTTWLVSIYWIWISSFILSYFFFSDVMTYEREIQYQICFCNMRENTKKWNERIQILIYLLCATNLITKFINMVIVVKYGWSHSVGPCNEYAYYSFMKRFFLVKWHIFWWNIHSWRGY